MTSNADCLRVKIILRFAAACLYAEKASRGESGVRFRFLIITFIATTGNVNVIVMSLKMFR